MEINTLHLMEKHSTHELNKKKGDDHMGNNVLSCIIGVIIVILVLAGIGFLTSDNSDDENKIKVNATDTDFFYYYGPDTPAGKTHTYGIGVNGTMYYMTDTTAELLSQNDNRLSLIMMYDLNKYDGKYSPDAKSYGTSGINYVWVKNKSKDMSQFTFPNSQNFTFTYYENRTVGLNDQAYVIDKVYYPNGTEITSK